MQSTSPVDRVSDVPCRTGLRLGTSDRLDPLAKTANDGQVDLVRVRLGIAVVAFNSDATLSSCLSSISAHCPSAAVAITENSAHVAQVKDIAARYPSVSVSVLDPGGNVGFSRGVNLAAASLRKSGCTHLLILNPDVELLDDPAKLIPFLAEADIVGGVLISDDAVASTVSARLVTPSNVKRRVTWASSLLQALVGTRFNGARAFQADVLQPVPQLDGAFLLQTMAYYSGNPLDERFELYFEDVDYCDRGRTGRGVALFGGIVGRHVGGVSYRSSEGAAYVVNRVSHARYLRGRYPRAPRSLLVAPFAVEVFTRAMTRQPEGGSVRARAFRLVREEIAHPGTVRVLQGRARVAHPGEIGAA